MSETSHSFWNCDRNSQGRFCRVLCLRFWADYYILIYDCSWELIKAVGSHGSSSLLFAMMMMVWHFVSAPHKVMTALFLVLPSRCRVVEISLQFHRYAPSLIQRC
jgi:hypothetical protein